MLSGMKTKFINPDNPLKIVTNPQETETIELKKSTSELKEAVISIVGKELDAKVGPLQVEIPSDDGKEGCQ